jgi:Ca2+-transporting ATPase
VASKKPAIENPHSNSADDLLSALETDQESGLSHQEADERFKKYGPNQLKEQDSKSILQIVVDQVNNPIVYLLSAAALLAFVFGDIPEGIAIVVVLVLNTIIGFWMEYQAMQSMNALKEMDNVMASVIREGEEKEINAEQLVPGDIITLEAGDLVPADARLIDASELTIDESPLTGESVPVSKETDPIEQETQVADRTNMVFKGTAVTNGRGKAVIVTTGMDTEIGTISEMVSSAEKEQIPLNRKLELLTKRLIWVTLGLAGAFFVTGWATGTAVYQLVQTSIAWTIAAIPEGLPIVASIALAKGMLRLADHNVIVKRLAAVETLGETTVIFTDKTGTLTENSLTLRQVEFEGISGKVKWENKEKATISLAEGDGGNLESGDERLKRFFEISVLCNDADLRQDESGEKKGDGDPLDISLLQFGQAYDDGTFKELRGLNRIDDEPFDSDDMVMGTVYEVDGKTMLFCKGGAEAIVNRCSSSFTEDVASDLSDEMKQTWINRNEELSEDGLRVIAYAFRELDQAPADDADVEKELMQDLTFLCLTGFIDPPREEVKEAIAICRKAGIKVVMVTGDHPGTARNIAREISMADEDSDQAIHGGDLRNEEVSHSREDIVSTRIFARVDPEQKLKLINYYQKNGDIVAMTGDGVNDAPALKKADIGISMGKRGTQVAQEVSDMVLKNDAFSSIVEAIREGRIIFGNIRKFIMYQLSYHLSEILIIAGISFTVFALPLLPLQLLFLNLLSDVFPALALGIGKGSPEIMDKPPKDPDEPIINRKNWFMIASHGLILTVYIVGAYFFASIYWGLSDAVCNNVAFFSLAFAQLWHVFDMREASEDIFNNQVTQNKYVWWAIALCVTAIIASYFIPQISNVLSYQELSREIWTLIGITSVLPIITIQTLKELSKNWEYKF